MYLSYYQKDVLKTFRWRNYEDLSVIQSAMDTFRKKQGIIKAAGLLVAFATRQMGLQIHRCKKKAAEKGVKVWELIEQDYRIPTLGFGQDPVFLFKKAMVIERVNPTAANPHNNPRIIYDGN